MSSSDSLEKLLTLLNIDRKKEVERHCRDLVITSEDLVNLIIGGRSGVLGPYQYACHFHEISPDELEPTDGEIRALGLAKPGPLVGRALKAVRKMNQGFRDRRLLAVHLFYTRSQRYWHLFYFDQRDYGERQNHWKHGPHIHYSRESFVQQSLEQVWAGVCNAQPVFPKSIHISYDYHHNRRRAAAA
ncbi:MAG: hypothetical protein WAW73_21400 [Rhodoferax sp.]